MQAIRVGRDPENGKVWLCQLGDVELYRGPSANKAQDLADKLSPEVNSGAVASYARGSYGTDGKNVWSTLLGNTPVNDFGSSANKAADLADKINEALAHLRGATAVSAPASE